MSNKWTKEQQSAIDLRNCSILVSAAAGSGKTAVLVERIIKKVLDENNPINIDQVVVVTFTKAAAGEMRDRIRAAIEKEAAAHPENTHLQKQKTLIHHANITTIDAFCTMIIKSHFDKIDMDPSSRVAENGEIKMIMSEAMSEVVEEYYRKEAQGELNGEFINLVEKVSPGKDDLKLNSLIERIYNDSMSYAFPEKWLDGLADNYNCENIEELENLDWMIALKDDVANLVSHIKMYVNFAMEIIKSPGGPYMYEPTFLDYSVFISQLEKCEKYVDYYDIVNSFSPEDLSKKKDEAVDKTLREETKAIRDECKKNIAVLRDKYFFQPAEQMQQDLILMRDNIAILCDIVKDFIECFSAKKREKNVHDFSDMSHMALKILVDEQGNPTEAAKEYAEYFDEIMIDEYQDSNFVQEILLSSISKRYKGVENVFMVGDAKQSIYRFRLARPELFTEKYDNYRAICSENNSIETTENNVIETPENGVVEISSDNVKIKNSGDRIRVDLFKNFRSRKEVLHSINYIFERIMKKSLGGIDYDENAALHPAAAYPENKAGANDTEILLFERKIENVTKHELEAEIIASKIKKLLSDVSPFLVTDKETGELRPCTYKDIAILVRSNTDLASSCMSVFEKENIPLVVPATKGYFEAEEIDTILNFLQVIDNPMQDIPFVTVLKSPIVSLSEDDLAVIRIDGKTVSFYEAVCNYVDSHIDEEDNVLLYKLSKFLKQLDLFREKVNIMPLHEFLWFVLDETVYGEYICAMPNGEQKNANMQMLISKAIDFESTSYIGIFQFVKYIEQIKSYDDKEGQALLINENENAVRLMTIHKSKGLEFPIVFVIGMGNEIYLPDEKAFLVIHPELGLGINAIDLKTRHTRKTLLKNTINRRMHLESMAEEMRILYVALTRAKEKLILSAGVDSIGKALQNANISNFSESISPITLSGQKSYIEWVLSALKYHPDMKEIYREYFESAPSNFTKNNWDCNLNISIVDAKKIIEEKLVNKMISEEKKIEFDESLKKAGNINDKLNKILNFKYQQEKEVNIPVKVSVSDIKKAFMDENEFAEVKGFSMGESGNDFENQTENQDVIQEEIQVDIMYPSFLKEEKEEVVGTDVGTLYHSIFEFLDYNRIGSYYDIKAQIEEMFSNELLDCKMKSYVNAEAFEKFASSKLGKRMQKAALNGDLWREQPFVLSVPAVMVNENAGEDETVLVQGIIDAFFIEDDELVLVDYKTDRVSVGGEDVLKRRYIKQMEYYKDALTRLFEKKVKECIIYSVSLNKEIII